MVTYVTAERGVADPYTSASHEKQPQAARSPRRWPGNGSRSSPSRPTRAHSSTASTTTSLQRCTRPAGLHPEAPPGHSRPALITEHYRFTEEILADNRFLPHWSKYPGFCANLWRDTTAHRDAVLSATHQARQDGSIRSLRTWRSGVPDSGARNLRTRAPGAWPRKDETVLAVPRPRLA
jgi:hypothetical protein